MAVSDVVCGVRALAAVMGGAPGPARPWASSAACQGSDPLMFFDSATEHAALTVCGGCPVATVCRADALAFERAVPALRRCPVGVMGGLTATERRLMHRRARAQHRVVHAMRPVPALPVLTPVQGVLFELVELGGERIEGKGAA
jgi:WhiB family redox-sensing transcriptional regulator